MGYSNKSPGTGISLPLVQKIKIKRGGRWLSSYEHWMFFQGTQLQSPALSWQLITTCNFSSKGSSTLFWFLRTLYTRGAETHMHTKHPQIENKNEGEIEEKHERQRGGKTIDVIRARWHIVLCSGSG